MSTNAKLALVAVLFFGAGWFAKGMATPVADNASAKEAPEEETED